MGFTVIDGVRIEYEGPLSIVSRNGVTTVNGKVKASGNVSCGAVTGDVKAGGNVTCGDVKGDVDAGGNVCRR